MPVNCSTFQCQEIVLGPAIHCDPAVPLPTYRPRARRLASFKFLFISPSGRRPSLRTCIPAAVPSLGPGVVLRLPRWARGGLLGDANQALLRRGRNEATPRVEYPTGSKPTAASGGHHRNLVQVPATIQVKVAGLHPKGVVQAGHDLRKLVRKVANRFPDVRQAKTRGEC